MNTIRSLIRENVFKGRRTSHPHRQTDGFHGIQDSARLAVLAHAATRRHNKFLKKLGLPLLPGGEEVAS